MLNSITSSVIESIAAITVVDVFVAQNWDRCRLLVVALEASTCRAARLQRITATTERGSRGLRIVGVESLLTLSEWSYRWVTTLLRSLRTSSRWRKVLISGSTKLTITTGCVEQGTITATTLVRCGWCRCTVEVIKTSSTRQP